MNNLKEDLDNMHELLKVGNLRGFITKWIKYLIDNSQYRDSKYSPMLWVNSFKGSGGPVSCNNRKLLWEEYESGELEELYARLPIEVLLRRYEITWEEGINK